MSLEAMQAASAQEVLAFWFEGDLDTRGGLEAAVERWFRVSESFDAEIRARFAATLDAAERGQLAGWQQSAPGWLALLIVLDQFPRNIHRGTARAFAADPLAQRIAQSGIDAGLDRALTLVQRAFAYLPLEHAEDIALQLRSVELFDALRDEAAPALRPVFDVFHDYAVQHREVIDRFGRFPHRNAVLGRPSTAAEEAYLAEPGAGF